MKRGSFWLKILNVYPNEWWIVKRLYLLQFFQGAGLAFLFTSAFAQFLERFPITELPWVLVTSAVLLWITGLAYTRLEHKLPFGKFNLILILFMSGSMLLLWVANYQVKGDWFFYLMMAWFNVLYLLNNMEFWGIAALLFDLRQSKRLFGVISAGDIPAKFIGYTLAMIFVPYTGTQNLLLLAAVCMLASLPFFNSILRSGKLDMHHQSDHHQKPKPAPRQISRLVNNLLTNSYIRRIAFISLVTSTCVILINYGFYGEVKKAYHDDVALAGFIAFFYSSLRIIAFVTKMVFTSRLTASLGIRPALFITPVGMLIFIAIIATVDGFTTDQKLIFYLFGVASMIVDVLRTSFNSPVLLTLMQPLPTHERLRAHNIVKGIMDPFASFFSGVFLLVLFYLHNKVDLMFLCYILLGLGVLWIGGVVLVNRQYLAILMKTIGTRYFSRDEFNLNDELIMQQVKTKMMTGTDLEVISILTMLNSKKIDTVAEELITELLQHPSDQVKIESLRLINSRNFSNARQSLENLLNSNVDDNVKQETVKTFCKIGAPSWGLENYLLLPQDEMRQAAITGMLGNPDMHIREKAEAAITALIISPEKEQRKKAIAILDEVKDQYDHPGHLQLLTDPDPVIRGLATGAVGKASRTETLRALFSGDTIQEKQVMMALYNAGPRAIPVIHDKLFAVDTTEALQEKLIVIAGKIGGDKAKKLLLGLLKNKPQHTETIIRGLYRCKYIADPETQKEFEVIARAYIVYGVELLYMQRTLSDRDIHYKVLNSSLQYEIHNIREILLSLFGCMYDREKMNQVKYGLNAKRKESIANAMEIIELTVKKDIGRQFNTLFETISIEQRCDSLRMLFTEAGFTDIEHILTRILSEKPIGYYSWTKAWSLYLSKKYAHPLQNSIYRKYEVSENSLLRETALFAGSST